MHVPPFSQGQGFSKQKKKENDKININYDKNNKVVVLCFMSPFANFL